MKYLKYNEAQKMNKLPLDEETMEDLILDIQDDGVYVRLAYATESDERWLDFYEYSEILNVHKVGWMLEFQLRRHIGNIHHFNEYFKILNKIHLLVNRINIHFDCKNIEFTTNPENFDGILVTIEKTPTIEDALKITHSYLKSYEDDLSNYNLNLYEIKGDAISFGIVDSENPTIEDFTKLLREFVEDEWTMTWKAITKQGDIFLVHGLKVGEVNFKY